MLFRFNIISQDIIDEVVELRRRIHSNPEMGNQEYATAALVEEYLNGLGIPTSRVLDTAVIGIIDFAKPGKTVALRADMDALPVCELTGVDYASQNEGVMHACGHDVHTASLLGAAKLLVSQKENLCGRCVLIFQPDEEGDGGARRLIAKGVMKGVDAVFGAHVAPDIEAGKVGVRYGKFYAAADMFDVTIKGVSAHGASPEKGADALATAAKAVVDLKAIPTTQEDKCVISTGMLHSGTARNIIADKAEFSGIIRSLGAENRAYLRKLVRKTITDACETYGTSAEISFRESYMGIVNSKNETAVAEAAALMEFDKSALVIIDEPLMTTEDFGYFIDESVGSFYHIGAGCTKPLHSPEFLPSDEALVTAMRMHAAVVCEYLSR
ncbi:MAG: M20 family metallopeptidase [Firmicutes bacterium]|nr:M20 family metallopeptidase [Bacillota bacterium]